MKKIMVVWLCAILMVSAIGIIFPITANPSEFRVNSPLYATHNPIYINGNADFTSANGVTGGIGTQIDPYIIEDWDINASSANGIEIDHTDAYFIIRNCYVHDGKNNYHRGIYFDSVQNGRIENTILSNNYDGIYVVSSSNNNISNNSANSNKWSGISLAGSNNNVSNNSASNNYYGISLHFSSNNNIYNNTASNNNGGIHLYSSSNNIIHNNSILGNVYSALYSRYSSGIDARYNYFGTTDQKQIEKILDYDSGVDHSNWLSYRESNVQYINTTVVWTGTVVLDKGVIVNGDLSIEDATVVFANFLGQNSIQVNGNLTIANSAVRSNYGNYTILYLNRTNGSIINSDIKGQLGLSIQSEEGISIRRSNLTHGYYGILINQGKNVTIVNCNILNNDYGAYMVSSSNNNIYNNSANSNYWGGISLDSSSNNNIYNNSASNNNNGIDLSNSIYNNIYNNSASNNNNGIGLYSSEHNNIYNNTASNNNDGIHLDSSSNNNIYNNTASNNNDGIDLSELSNNNILSNNSVLNNDYGIYLCWESSNNTFVFNNISYNNCSVKIYPSSCENNTFHHNNFFNGTVVNVIDNGADTKWDDGHSEGNYWSNYTGLDDGSGGRTAGDGVGDTNVPHMGLDNYPLMVPVGQPYTPDTTPPMISSVAVSGITETSATITWTTDENSDSRVNYSVNADLSSNSTKYDPAMTTTHSITLTGLSSGITYYFEVSSTDGSGNTATANNNSNYYRFTTLEEDTTSPVISSVSVSGITANSATITWTTDENSDSRVNYSTNSDLSSNSTKYDSTMTTTHSIAITGLSPGTTYYFEVSSTDGSGNTATANNNSNYYIFTTLGGDTTPPVISLVSVSDITDNSATITWTTDENSDSRVNYSVNADLSSNSTKYDSTMTTTHSITLTGLNSNTTYYFEVSSADSSGNTVTDNNSTHYYTFTTETEAPTTGGVGFSILDYWWAIVLAVIIVVIVVIVVILRRKK